MDGLIALSEVARNVALPAIAVLGAMIALWQTRMGKRRNGFDLIVKAAELYADDNADRRLVAYALLLEAIENTQSRKMASRVFWPYIWKETDIETLRDCLRLAAGSSVNGWIEWRLDVVLRQDSEMKNDGRPYL